MTPDDDNVLRMLAGANFGPDSSVILPSGQRLGGDEAQALTSFYVDDGFDNAARHTARPRDAFLTHCRQATPDDYRAWLVGHIASGGHVTHKYDYDMPIGAPFGWVVLESDADLPPLHGAHALHVIVPEGLQIYAASGHSHNNVYLMAGYRVTVGERWVPSYRDVREGR